MARDKKNKPKKVYKGTGLYWGFLAVLVTLVALVILAAQNTTPVQFSFTVWDLEYPLVAVILATIGFTIVLDEAVGFVWRKRRRRVLAERAELRELRATAAGDGEPTTADASVGIPAADISSTEAVAAAEEQPDLAELGSPSL